MSALSSMSAITWCSRETLVVRSSNLFLDKISEDVPMFQSIYVVDMLGEGRNLPFYVVSGVSGVCQSGTSQISF